MNYKPTREHLLFYFEYNREAGTLKWINHQSAIIRGRNVGKVVTSKSTVGSCTYIRVRLNNELIMVHQIIWFLETGEWAKLIDHIDGDGTNNRFHNLRPGTTRQNMQNLKIHREGRLVGTYRIADTLSGRPRWVANIHRDGKVVNLGNFRTEREAHRRYVQELESMGLKRHFPHPPRAEMLAHIEKLTEDL